MLLYKLNKDSGSNYMKKLHFIPLYLTLNLLLLSLIGNSAISANLFADDERISMTPANSSVFIDLKDQNKADIRFRKELNDKSLADFSDFLRDSRNVYFAIWLIRIVQVNTLDISNKEQLMLDLKVKAIQQAKHKAQTMAVSLNQSIGADGDDGSG